jgi:CheY-like chemotaxis protein
VQRLRVLIADDHEPIRAMLRERLVEAGCEVVGEAGDGREAVALTASLSPDVVLMDHHMPVMSGTAATREITKTYRDVDVIAFSGVPHQLIKAEMLEAGASAFFDKLDLSGVVQAVMSRRHRQRTSILIVDDNADMREMLRLHLKRRGITSVSEAGDGAAAIAQMEEVRASVVVMDYSMPGMDGAEATEMIKSRWPDAVVYGFTSMKSEPLIRAGADDSFDKSELQKLLDAIESVITSRATD